MKNGFYKELAGMAQEAIDELNKFERADGNSSVVFDYIRRIAAPCLDGQSVKQSVLDDFPLREQMNFKRAVFAMASLYSLSGAGGSNAAIRSHIEYVRHWTTELSNRSKRTSTPKIF